jgi:hypothetical protein
VHVLGSVLTAIVPVPTGTLPTEYAPVADDKTAGRALLPVGVTVILALSMPPPRLLVMVPATTPAGAGPVLLLLSLPQAAATAATSAGRYHRRARRAWSNEGKGTAWGLGGRSGGVDRE